MDGYANLRSRVRALGEQARRESTALAAYLRALPERDWERPTACSKWTVKDIAAHVAGGGLYFRALLQAALGGEVPQPVLPDEVAAQRKAAHEALRRQPLGALADQIIQGTEGINALLDAAPDQDLTKNVALPFGRWPAWFIVGMRLSEVALHHWDVRYPIEPSAKLTPESADLLLPGLIEAAAILADDDTTKLLGDIRIQCHVVDGGPIALRGANGEVRAERGAVKSPTAILDLDADQFVRLLWGRLPLEAALARGEVTCNGDRATALALNGLFRGR